MSSTCSCAQHVKKLNQQISVMRKEIKNLRLLIDSAVRTHRKHVVSLQSLLRNSDQQEVRSHTNPSQNEGVGKNILLEQGHIQTVPIGHIISCFTAKNGTPRQPSVCGQSRATLQIESTVFNNPQHALIGLDHYSHIWIIFIFHKNGHLSSKAKVKPPRLNGQRVGVYSTRSPHRPNALGLTLAKLEHITGDTLHLSGIDMITGTPVLDIKPYIPEYDSPYSRTDFGTTVCPEAGGSLSVSQVETGCSPTFSHTGGCMVLEEGLASASDTRPGLLKEKSTAHVLSTGDPASHSPQVDDVATVLGEIKSYIRQSNVFTQRTEEENAPLTDCTRAEPCESQRAEPKTEVCYDEASFSQVASWIREPPVTSLCVRFTPNAKSDLDQFLPPGKRVLGRPSFRFLQSPEDAAAAIRGVLHADPRSVYRRTCCPDRLFYFTLDSAHITCWFGCDFAEVVQVRSAEPTATGPAD